MNLTLDLFLFSFQKKSFSNIKKSNKGNTSSSENTYGSQSDNWSSWQDDNEGFVNSPLNKMEELRKEREEKKLQRQKEIEAKRAARSGPMKLGAKKVQL